ncbi:MAG: ABC transporter permease subunit [Clostridia bacterium]
MVKKYVNKFGLPRLIILAFLLSLCIAAFFLGIPMDQLLSSTLVRVGMNGILVLAMVPAIVSGIGPNFGLPLGIICGLLGVLVTFDLDMRGFSALFTAMIISIPPAVLLGAGYGWILNKIKGSEMMIATYIGFSSVALMNIGWILLPFRSSATTWPIGRGLRLTISLEGRIASLLDNFLSIRFGNNQIIPVGMLLFFLFACFIVWLFMRSKSGVKMYTAGVNPKFAESSGINVNQQRLLGTILSTVLGAIGIIVYSQSYTFLQLYKAPMYMAFPSVAAILIGGASTKRASIANVIIGVILFQSLLVVALPVANQAMQEGNLAEITRIIVSNGIILYALTQAKKDD